MTCFGSKRNADAVSFLDDVEPLQEAISDHCAAEQMRGRLCFQPECGRVFDAARVDQRFCSTACRQAHVREMRAVGHRIAEAVLLHRQGKYAKPGSRGARLASAARKWLGKVQTAWNADRVRRAESAAERHSVDRLPTPPRSVPSPPAVKRCHRFGGDVQMPTVADQ